MEQTEMRQRLVNYATDSINELAMYDYTNTSLRGNAMYYDCDEIAIRRHIIKCMYALTFDESLLNNRQLIRLAQIAQDKERFKDVAQTIAKECTDVYSNDAIAALWRYVCGIEDGYRELYLKEFHDMFFWICEKIYRHENQLITVSKVKSQRRGECRYKVTTDTKGNVFIDMETFDGSFIVVYPKCEVDMALYPVFASDEILIYIKRFFEESLQNQLEKAL